MNAALKRRLVQLEKRRAAAAEAVEAHGVVMAPMGMSLDMATCVRILREAGRPTACVNLGLAPRGLNAKELETYLRTGPPVSSGPGEPPIRLTPEPSHDRWHDG
jgi:hypothetical protein